ncbi:MAG: tetratricopeptide repeat protein [Candidatus Thiodiazotropha sp.]|jgi:lipopolysaccharide biosynthesis regulator YciM
MEIVGNSTNLFGIRWIIASGFIFIILIIINFLSQHDVKDLAASNLSSNISGIYLKALIKIDPKDSEARMMLVRHYYEFAKWNDAYLALLPIANNNSDLDTKIMLFNILQNEFFTLKPETEEYSIIKSSLISELYYIADNIHALSKSELVYYAKFSMQLSCPDIATMIYEYLADNDTNQTSYWLNLAAEAQLAYSQPQSSAQLYHMAFLKSSVADTANYYAHKALESFLYANMVDSALVHLPLYIDRFPYDKVLLEKGRELSLATQNHSSALEYGRKLISLDPDNEEQILKQRDLGLSAGNHDVALSMSKRLIEINARNIEYQYKYAHIAEWAQKYDAALAQWKRIALNFIDYTAFDHAIRLSKGTSDYLSLIDILKSKSLSKSLSNNEIDDIIFAYMKNNNTYHAIEFLSKYTQSYKEHIYALESLAYLHEKNNDLDNAISTWIKIMEYSNNQVESIIKISELAIRNNDKEYAYTIMLDNMDINYMNNKRYLEILGNLSWDLENSSVAIMLYRKLWSLDKTNTFYAERLILLYTKQKFHEKAADIAVEVYGNGKNPRFLLLAIDILSSISDWASVKALLMTAKENEILFKEIELYWLQNALAAMREHEYSKADECYNRALNLNPKSRPAEIGLLWLYIETDNKKRLTEYFTRTSINNASSNSEYWQVYAIALAKLGWTDQAQHWFQLLIKNNSHDISTLKSFSDTLSHAGKNDSATRINNYIFSSQRNKLLQSIATLAP